MTGDAVTAVVLCWRTPQHALRARASLCEDGVAPERILLVDNGSPDASAETLRAGAGASPVLALPANIGFARANNLAARELPARRCLLFVNADAGVHRPGSVAALVAAVADPGTVIAVPRLRHPDGSLQPSVVAPPTPLAEIVRASGLSRLVPDRWQPSLGTGWTHAGSRDIRTADGPVLAVDAEAFRMVGGFAERTFMYGEDHDLFMRLARHGGRARFVAEAEFVHVGAAGSSQRWDAAARVRRAAHARAALLLDEAGDDRRGGPAAVAVAAMALGAAWRTLAWTLLRRPARVRSAAELRGCAAAVRDRLRCSRRT